MVFELRHASSLLPFHATKYRIHFIEKSSAVCLTSNLGKYLKRPALYYVVFDLLLLSNPSSIAGGGTASSVLALKISLIDQFEI